MGQDLRSLTWVKIIYTTAMFGLGLCSTTIVQWIMFYYAPPADIGVTIYLGAGAVGMAMALGRIIDAWVDPVIGYFSDRTVSRFGRRRPYMLFSIPVFLISFILLWIPPTSTPSIINMLWVAVLLSAFFVAFSLYAVPYLALLPEMATNRQERVFLALTQSVFFALGATLATLGPPLLSNILDASQVPMLWAVLAAVSLLVPLFVIKEEDNHSATTAAVASTRELLISVKRNSTLFFWAFSLFCVWTGLCIIVKLLPYLYTFVQIEPTSMSPWLAIPILFLIILVFFSGYRAVTIKGVKATFLPCLIVAGIATIILASTNFFWLPGHFWIILLLLSLVILPAAVLPVALQNAVTAEIAIQHSLQEGYQQEALLFSIQGLAAKLALAVGALSLGLILDLFSYSIESAAGIRAGYFLAGFFLLAAAGFMQRYPHKNGINTD